MTTPACVRCGVFLNATTDVTYSDEGDPMCVGCRDRIDLDRKDRREARKLLGLAVSSLAGSMFGFPVAILFVLGGLFMSLPAFGSGVLCLRELKEASPGTRMALGGQYGFIRAAAVAGVGLSGLALGIMAVQIASVLLELATQRR